MAPTALEETSIPLENEQSEELLLSDEKNVRYITLQQVVLIVFLLLLTALGLINYKRYRDKRRHVMELAAKTKKIDKQFNLLKQTNEQNELLLREIHHRVKNNLQLAASLLNMQLRTSDNDEAISALRESAGRLHSMLLVHQELYSHNHFEAINMLVYTRNLTDYLIQSYALDEYQAIPEIAIADNVKLKTDIAIPLGLIMTELITNSLKYAQPEDQMIYIAINLIKTTDHEYELAYCDNGKGLPETVDIKSSRTMGMRLIRDLTRQLKGTLIYEHQQSSFFRITFKDF